MVTGPTMRGFSSERFTGTKEDERTPCAIGVSSARTGTVSTGTHLRRCARSSTARALTLETSSVFWQMRTGGGCHSPMIGCAGLATRSIATEGGRVSFLRTVPSIHEALDVSIHLRAPLTERIAPTPRMKRPYQGQRIVLARDAFQPVEHSLRL